MTLSKSPAEPLKLLLTKETAANALSISLRSLDYLIANKQIPTRQIGRRVLVPVGALKRYALADHTGSIRRSA
jgi:excisionase family DNA binding protein